MEDSLQVQVARYLLEKSILSLRLWTWLDMYYMSSHVACRVTAPGDAQIRGTYTEKLGFLNIIRYGLVARISRSQTVLTTTQPGPRRPGFNSPCRNLLLFLVREFYFCRGCGQRNETEKNEFLVAKIFGFVVDVGSTSGVGGVSVCFE